MLFSTPLFDNVGVVAVDAVALMSFTMCYIKTKKMNNGTLVYNTVDTCKVTRAIDNLLQPSSFDTTLVLSLIHI